MSAEDEDKIPVRRGRVDSLTLYDVTEQELAELERGGSGHAYLDFSLTFCSTAIAFLIAILTMHSFDSTKIIFIIICSVCALGTIIFFVLWRMHRTTMKVIIRRIKARLSDEEKETDPDATTKV
ncbi:MAG: hypothetical protein ACYDCJ_10100 [Gammaproteobacteria bacterium]